ncbi:hypothetical protein CU280_06890 [Yersinia mollaretii]|nr:hypothetical protein CU280_06890 [Yersinia mollaretii]
MIGVSVSLANLINVSCAILSPRVMTQQLLRLSVVQADRAIIPSYIRHGNGISCSFRQFDKYWQCRDKLLIF